MMSSEDCVKVAVRIRPLVPSEQERGCQNIIDKTPNVPQVLIDGGRSNEMYTFNYVFSQDDTQETVYDDAVESLLDPLFKGYNVTILAYGQTGSGKTHTMGTAFDGSTNNTVGVIPRAVDDIFRKISEDSNAEFKVTCAFMELYQEHLYDLLSTKSRDQQIIEIREDPKVGICLPNLTEMVVTNATETTSCLTQGSAGRVTGATAMNAQSSRSHAIFTITIHRKSGKDQTTAKFHLVDLAGSERSKKTKASGERMKEGININKGLLALGNVISALGTGNSGHVPYRDSKLTRLLQDSLGGNSITLMIACVSPADYNLEETVSTLRYADRAKKIKNKPVVNKDPHAAEVARLQAIIHKLRLDMLQKDSGNTNQLNSSSSVEFLKIKSELDLERSKSKNLRQQLQATLYDHTNMEMKAIVSEQTHENLMIKIAPLKTLIRDLNASFHPDTCPVEFMIHAKSVASIKEILDEIDEMFLKNTEDIQNINKENHGNSSGNSNLIVSEEISEKNEQFTQIQIKFSEEMRQLNKELALKEELHQKYVGNLSQISIVENCAESNDKVKEYEEMILRLEKEKDELLSKLNTSGKVPAKISEERRKKLQLLEQQITDMRKKNLQQAKMLKMKEKDSVRITNLNKEIQEMKAKKVKLVREMRSESENFKSWKLKREKEICQLKEKDRKRQNDMVRMENLHNKQQNVLKRKVEEANAVNKRLKDVLDKQKTVQNHKKLSANVDQIASFVDQELDVILSVVDAQVSLKTIMDDRAVLYQRLDHLKQEPTTDPTQISLLEEDLAVRNAQITDLQQKIVSSKIDSKIKALEEPLNSTDKAKAGFRHVLQLITEMRKDVYEKETKLEDVKNNIEMVEDKCQVLEQKLKEEETKRIQDVNEIEKVHAEQKILFWRELGNRSAATATDLNSTKENERYNYLQDALDELEKLREVNENLRTENAILQKDHTTFLRPKTRVNYLKEINCLDTSFATSDESDSEYEDPSFRTPIPLKSNRNSNQNKSDIKIEILNETGTRINCGCKTKCNHKICSCQKGGRLCTADCKCNPDICVNKERKRSLVEDDDDEDDEENVENHTPKKIKIEDETKILEVATPSYPYSKKKMFYK